MDTIKNPIASEFFFREAVRGEATPIVREALKTSVDVRPQNIDVATRATTHVSEGSRTLAAAAWRWFSGIEPQAQADGNWLSSRNPPDTTYPYIVILDFNTTALKGHHQTSAVDQGMRYNFPRFSWAFDTRTNDAILGAPGP